MVQSAVFISLVVGHLLADFPLQTDAVYRLKQKGWKGLLLHSGIHLVVAIALVPGLLSRWGLLLALGASHLVIDAVKPHVRFARPSITFLIDQAVHVLSLVVIAWFAQGLRSSLSPVMLYWLLPLTLIPAAIMFISLLKQEGSLKWRWFLPRAGEGETTGELYQIVGWAPILVMALAYLRTVG